MVVLQTTSISKNADSYHTPNGHNPSASTAEKSLYDAFNPGCQDDLIQDTDRNVNAKETLVESLTDALTAITFDQGNTETADIHETYSLNSESEIFITERQPDMLNNDDRPVGRLTKCRSHTSDSSRNTDNESLEPLDNNDERNLDESIM